MCSSKLDLRSLTKTFVGETNLQNFKVTEFDLSSFSVACVCTQSSCLFWGDSTNSTPLTTSLGAPYEAPTAQLRPQNAVLFQFLGHGLSCCRSKLLFCQGSSIACSVWDLGYVRLLVVSEEVFPGISFSCLISIIFYLFDLDIFREAWGEHMLVGHHILSRDRQGL